MTNEEAINKINKRIKDLKEHQIMWLKAGGMGGRMAMDACSEIKSLEEEKKLLESGKSYKDIEDLKRITNEIRMLKYYREQVFFLKRNKITKEIEELEEKSKEISFRLR